MDSASPSATQRQLVNRLPRSRQPATCTSAITCGWFGWRVLPISDAGRAEEIVQDAFVDLVARWRTIRDPGFAGEARRHEFNEAWIHPSHRWIQADTRDRDLAYRLRLNHRLGLPDGYLGPLVTQRTVRC